MSAVRKIGTVTLNGTVYDLAVNGTATLGLEGRDLYDRPATRPVPLAEAAGVGWSILAQQLLDALAAAMKERDAALASLQKGSG